MTRLSLILVSSFVAGVIAFAPQKDTGAAFRPAPVKTRSLSGISQTPAVFKSQIRTTCVPATARVCKASLPGSEGPRG